MQQLYSLDTIKCASFPLHSIATNNVSMSLNQTSLDKPLILVLTNAFLIRLSDVLFIYISEKN